MRPDQTEGIDEARRSDDHDPTALDDLIGICNTTPGRGPDEAFFAAETVRAARAELDAMRRAYDELAQTLRIQRYADKQVRASIRWDMERAERKLRRESMEHHQARMELAEIRARRWELESQHNPLANAIGYADQEERERHIQTANWVVFGHLPRSVVFGHLPREASDEHL